MLKFQSTAAVEKSELVKHAGYLYPESCKKSISDVIRASLSKVIFSRWMQPGN